MPMPRIFLAVLCLSISMQLLGVAADTNAVPLPRPRRVTIEATKQPVAEILKSLTKQTGIFIGAKSDIAAKPITISLSDSAFWPALDALAKAANARVDLYDRSGKLQLKARRDDGSDQLRRPVSVHVAKDQRDARF